MPLTARKRPRIGDVIEIPTPIGLAYAQYSHKHDRPPKYGALLRVLPGTYPSRPSDFSEIVNQKERFLVFFPLGAACNRGIVTVVAEEGIPEWARPFPTFRHGFPDRNGVAKVWFIWSGGEEVRVEKLSPEQQKLPRHPGVWNDTLLIQRIAENWVPPS